MIALLPLILANPAPPMFLSHEVLAEKHLGGFESETCVVATSEEDYETLWSMVMGMMHVIPPPPEVDFDSSFVLGIFPGERPTAGYGVEVGQVSIWYMDLIDLFVRYTGLIDPLVASGVVIEVYAREKCPEGAAAQVITCPWPLLRVKRSPYFPLDTEDQALSVDMSLERCPGK